MLYLFEVVGARNVATQYYNNTVEAGSPLDALGKARQIGQARFGRLYRVTIIEGEDIENGMRVAEFLSQRAARKRGTIEDMPELKTAGRTGLIRVRPPRSTAWQAVTGLEARI